ncbi:MAG: hypothetical protein U0894_15485 [Pirellulales bacterium]
MLASQLGLNEAVVTAGPPFSMLNVNLLVDGELATTYACDGLIISTPVGSTARFVGRWPHFAGRTCRLLQSVPSAHIP